MGFIKKTLVATGLVLGGAVLLTALPISLTSCGSSKKDNDSTTTAATVGNDGIIAEPEALKEMPAYYQLPEKQINVKPTSGDAWTAKSAEEYWQNKAKNYTLQDYKNDLKDNINYQNQLLTKKMPYFNWTSMSDSKDNPNDFFRQFMIFKLGNVSLNKDKTLNFTIKTSLITQIANTDKKIIAQQSLNNTFVYSNSKISTALLFSNSNVYNVWEPYYYTNVNITISQSNLLNLDLINRNINYINNLEKNQYWFITIGDINKLSQTTRNYKPNWSNWELTTNDLSNMQDYTFSSKDAPIYLMSGCSDNSLTADGTNYMPGFFQGTGKNNLSFGNIKEVTSQNK